MSEKSSKTLFGLSPASYGIASLIAGFLIIGDVMLLVASTSGGAVFVFVPLVLVPFGVISGLLGIGAGIYYRDLLGSITALLGLALFGYFIRMIVVGFQNF